MRLVTGHSPYKTRQSFMLLCKHTHNCLPAFALLIADLEMVRFELMTPCLQGRCSPN